MKSKLIKKLLSGLLITLLIPAHGLFAQYAPQAGLAGSAAISAGSSQFVSWAIHCSLHRGWLDIADTSLGCATFGDSSLATGIPDGGVVSLGDSGIADLTFLHPIINGSGPDFAVFENGFRDFADSSLAYLELAFVEVSSDGINYFRFPASSLTATDVQVSNAGYMNAVNINNLAGKYIGMYGTPFDLDELAGTPGLDVNNVTHVRLIDVVGSVGAHASHDHSGRIINDPYPSPFPSCGFDLDAVGVIHEAFESVNRLQENIGLMIYPNPSADFITIGQKGGVNNLTTAQLTTITGNVVFQTNVVSCTTTMSLTACPPGIYYLLLNDTNGNKWTEKIIRR